MLYKKMEKLKHISEFKKGEILIQPNPVPVYRSEFDEVVGANVLIKERVDTSYTGIPLEYVGRTKKNIYFKSQSNSDLHFKKGTKFGIPYDIFQDGWTKRIDSKSSKEIELKFMPVNNLLFGKSHRFYLN